MAFRHLHVSMDSFNPVIFLVNSPGLWKKEFCLEKGKQIIWRHKTLMLLWIWSGWAMLLERKDTENKFDELKENRFS